jgi:DNA-binding transcriptional ArsR family regulator
MKITVSDDFKICLKIWEFNRNNEKIWFSNLVEEMSGSLTQSSISRPLDKLFDHGIVESRWENVDGYWTRTLNITEDISGFTKGLSNVTNC